VVPDSKRAQRPSPAAGAARTAVRRAANRRLPQE